MLAKRDVFIFFGLLFILPLVSAVDTQINVKTLANHKVSIFVIAPEDTYRLLESFHINADATGMVSVKYSGIDTEIKVNVKITKDGKTVIFEKFPDEFRAGENLYLKVIPGDVSTNYMEEEKANEAEEVENNETLNKTEQQNVSVTPLAEEKKEEKTTNSSSSKKLGISGSAILGEIKKYTKIYYIVGIILIAGVIVFFIWRSGVIGKIGDKFNSDSSSYDYDPIKYNFKDKEIDTLEKKMKTMQSEINRIKNQKRITEAEKKLEEDRKSLDRLKKGEDV